MAKSFWKDQPVEKGISLRTISEARRIPKERLSLPKGLFWEINDNPLEIAAFLKENYVEDCDNMFRLNYSKDFFEYLFQDPNHSRDYSLSIINDNRDMVGYVLAKEHTVVIRNVEQRVVSINFLCLKEEYRNKNIAPIIIKEITRVVNMKGIFHAVFTGQKDYGFAIGKSMYYHLAIDVSRLKAVGYIEDEWEDALLSECDKYKISNETRIASKADLRRIYKKYCDSFQECEFYEKFSEEEFMYVFGGDKTCVYMLYNEKRNEYVSFFVIESFSIHKEKSFQGAYLYYWDGGYRIIEDAISYAKSLGISIFNVLDLHNNEKIIREFRFVEGTGILWYHLYNWRESSINKEKINFILF